ncbi:MAG: lytic transglycosylase domain-containing protein [Pelagibacteraceae bacterium]|nr:lytic transglycosylase domain-containing protein [Pelagibacteraceae bacterium]
MSKKKFIIFVLTLLISFNLYNKIIATETEIIPLKKPNLSKQENNTKILSSSLKPLQKPIKKNQTTEEVITSDIKIDKKLELKVPKKKPLIVVTNIKPKINISKYYNSSDFEIAKKAVSEMKKKEWTTSLKTAKKASDKSIHNFIQWNYLSTSENTASFYDYKFFIENNKNYPNIDKLRLLAENKLSIDVLSPKKIIDWFKTHEPLSGYGQIILGESYILTGELNRGKELIKKGWITADLSKNQLISFRKRYKKYLDPNDQIKRADYLAWNNKPSDLNNLLNFLPSNYKLLYTARKMLMTNAQGIDQALANIPQDLLNDAGLNYDRLKWRRKRDLIDGSVEILTKIKNPREYLVRPDKWWAEREIISRTLIYEKKYDLAYKISSNHGLNDEPEFADAEWMSGWIALSFLKKPLLAKSHFENFYNNVNYPISKSRGGFWLGRTYEKLNDIENSKIWYQEAAKYLTTYYGQLAFLKINPKGNFKLEDDMKINEEYKNIFFNNELVKIVYLLDELNEDTYSKFLLRHLANDNINTGSEILAAELASNIERPDFAIQIAKFASYEKRFHNKYNYPILNTPKVVNGRKIPEAALILSIIRQESEFYLSAGSHVGAKGLMQIMPPTAKVVAKQANLPYSKSRLTSDVEYNINLGSHYIAGLISDYQGSYPYALVAYNAGPSRVTNWKKMNKDPQKKQIDYVDWVELIRFTETRNYVQRVLENYNVYRYILEKKPIPMKDFFKDQSLF